MESIIVTHELSKVYGNTEVVSNINLHLKKGEIYGFLGENGAGKSTVMKMLMNLAKPTSGTIELFGQELKENSYEQFKRIGAIIEEPVFYRQLSVEDNLKLHCEYMGYHNQHEIPKMLEQMNLRGIEKKKVAQLSLGMKQRLAIGRAILTKPELLILDEPINGLDPSGIKEVRELLHRLSEEDGVTILISSHILAEIEQLASKIGVLANHHLVKEVSMSEIHQLEGRYLELQVEDVRKTGAILESVLHLHNFRIMNDTTFRIYDKQVDKNEIMKVLMEHQIVIDGISKKELSLEEYFLNLVEEEK